MAPPDAQDPPEWDPDLESEVRELFEALEECEEDLADLERDVLILRKDIDEFLRFLQDHPGLERPGSLSSGQGGNDKTGKAEGAPVMEFTLSRSPWLDFVRLWPPALG